MQSWCSYASKVCRGVVAAKALRGCRYRHFGQSGTHLPSLIAPRDIVDLRGIIYCRTRSSQPISTALLSLSRVFVRPHGTNGNSGQMLVMPNLKARHLQIVLSQPSVEISGKNRIFTPTIMFDVSELCTRSHGLRALILSVAVCDPGSVPIEDQANDTGMPMRGDDPCYRCVNACEHEVWPGTYRPLKSHQGIFLDKAQLDGSQ